MSKIKELAGKTAGIQPRTSEKHHDRPSKTAPVMLYDATSRMHAAEQRAEELETRLREAEKNASSFEIALNELREVPGRRRKLTEEQFAELRENLRRNDLVTPITVRPLPEGGYEIVSGHNRAAAYRELGRERIPAVVQETDSVRAEMNAFYANLLQPTLPDYEKFLGFQLICRRHPDLTQEQIGEMTGISQSLVSRLLSFGELPPEALELLEKKSAGLGATAAQNLVAYAKQGKAKEVVEAVRKIVMESVDQSTALAVFSQPKRETGLKREADVKSYKVGRSLLCEYRKAGTTLRLDFKTQEDVEAVHEEIQKVLEAYAARRKLEKK